MRSAYPDCLVDTNILLYPADPRERAKSRRCLEVLAAVNAAKVGYVSPQILGELFVGLRGLRPPLSPQEMLRQVRYYVQYWTMCRMDSDTAMEAIRGALEHQLAYYDALIWATAKRNYVPVVLSEDCTDGRVIEGVLFRNPLEPSFSLDDLVSLP